MANPKFRNHHDATDEYTWVTLNLQPDPPVAAIRDFATTEHELRDGRGRLLNVWKSSERRVWRCSWVCDETQMLELQSWFERGAFLLFPDAAVGTSYSVVWEAAEFAPQWRQGGKYALTAVLREA